MIEVEVSHCVDEVIGEHLAETMNAMIPRVHSVSIVDQSEISFVMGNIVVCALPRSSKKGHLDDLIDKCLTGIVDTEQTTST